MKDLYQEVTNRIVAALEAGTPPWVRPWSAEADPVPVNAGSHRPYRGINVLLLSLEALARGYSRNRWLTYRQAAELGGQVRGGARGTQVVFFKMHEVPEKDSPPEAPATRQVPLLRSFTVFNVAQVDGLPGGLQATPAAPPSWSPHEEPERLLASSGARIRHGGARAFYQPAEDYIRLPERGLFSSSSEYAATALHELTHWTGHVTRCNRELGKRFGETAYAMEELIAEMGRPSSAPIAASTANCSTPPTSLRG
jgi:antirestriction protein ArdC